MTPGTDPIRKLKARLEAMGARGVRRIVLPGPRRDDGEAPPRAAAAVGGAASAGAPVPAAPGPGGKPDAAPPGEPDVVRVRHEATLFGASASASGGPRKSREELIGDVRAKAMVCTQCALHKTRTNVVFGDGNIHADLVFVGEAPGADEDAQGLPFVGRAGQLLNRMIAAIGLKRKDVYICNVLKCRPPNNRAPAPDEVRNCSPYLGEQLDIIKPIIICALGAPATQTLLKTKISIGALRGRFHDYCGIPTMATYHPAYVLRSYTEDVRRTVWEDLKKVRAKLEELRAKR